MWQHVSALVALTLASSACASNPSLPPANDADGWPTLAPDCREHLAQIRTMPIAVVNVPADDLRLGDYAGSRGMFLYRGQDPSRIQWHEMIIFVVVGLAPQLRRAVLDHELCHAWRLMTTGDPQFHSNAASPMPDPWPLARGTFH